MIDVSAAQLQIIQTILRQIVPGVTVLAFGSRVTGKAKPYSDLDLAIKGEQALDWRRLQRLKDAFASSDLPFSVDIVDWFAISAAFQMIISQNAITISI